MAIIISVILVASGAIIFWGVEGTAANVDVGTLGVILMAAGGVGLVAAVLLSARTVSAGESTDVPGRDPVAAPDENAWPDRHGEAQKRQ